MSGLTAVISIGAELAQFDQEITVERPEKHLLQQARLTDFFEHRPWRCRLELEISAGVIALQECQNLIQRR
ncbi:MAG: hypothetical protein ACR2RF_10960 [Geminicoccaceae bacterium]